MRKGIAIEVTPADRARLQSIIRDRNSPQKHVWRARIVLLTADGQGTTAVMRAVGKGKTVVWRWQERFMHGGVDGLTRDKTRPSRIPPLPAETVDRVVALTNQAPPHEATHWTAAAIAKARPRRWPHPRLVSRPPRRQAVDPRRLAFWSLRPRAMTRHDRGSRGWLRSRCHFDRKPDVGSLIRSLPSVDRDTRRRHPRSQRPQCHRLQFRGDSVSKEKALKWPPLGLA